MVGGEPAERRDLRIPTYIVYQLSGGNTWTTIDDTWVSAMRDHAILNMFIVLLKATSTQYAVEAGGLVYVTPMLYRTLLDSPAD